LCNKHHKQTLALSKPNNSKTTTADTTWKLQVHSICDKSSFYLKPSAKLNGLKMAKKSKWAKKPQDLNETVIRYHTNSW